MVPRVSKSRMGVKAFKLLCCGTIDKISTDRLNRRIKKHNAISHKLTDLNNLAGMLDITEQGELVPDKGRQGHEVGKQR